MDVKFKVGDKIRRKLSCKYNPGLEGLIIKIGWDSDYPLDHELLYITHSSGVSVVWFAISCELINHSEHLCSCDLDIIMAVGCQCKGN